MVVAQISSSNLFDVSIVLLFELHYAGMLKVLGYIAYLYTGNYIYRDPIYRGLYMGPYIYRASIDIYIYVCALSVST